MYFDNLIFLDSFVMNSLKVLYFVKYLCREGERERERMNEYALFTLINI